MREKIVARILVATMWITGFVFGVPASAQTAQGAQGGSLVAMAQVAPAMAEQIALEYVGGGMVSEVVLERRINLVYYEVEIMHNGQRFDVDIDAVTGTIVRSRARNGARFFALSGNASLVEQIAIPFARAEQIALEQAGGGTVMEIELERGRLGIHFDIEINYNFSRIMVRVDAATGAVINIRLR